jgi:hypothetical protein
VDSRSNIPGLSRTESDAATALGAFVVVMLLGLCTVVLAMHLLSGLPPIMADGVIFSIVVFSIVCGVAFLRSDISPKRAGPPQVEFRNPVRRPKRRKAAPRNP